MSEYIPTREDAFNLLREYTETPALIKHALAVEAVMVHFAGKFGEDPVKWGVIGLVHDIDYDKFPYGHCNKCIDIFKEHNWPEEYIHAVVSHGWEICSDVKPEHVMEKVLYAADELTGLITATVLVRPSKSILDLELKSVKKKWKEKSFSVGVDRLLIEKGAKMLDMTLDDLITETITAMKNSAAEIDLKGNL
ncbi:MAG: hydrolase [Spirochaetes bacterium]|nr:hydrolase [Spirochaetota bacterium]